MALPSETAIIGRARRDAMREVPPRVAVTLHPTGACA
jgi:hypothetical protein